MGSVGRSALGRALHCVAGGRSGLRVTGSGPRRGGQVGLRGARLAGLRVRADHGREGAGLVWALVEVRPEVPRAVPIEAVALRLRPYPSGRPESWAGSRVRGAPVPGGP